MRNLIVSDIFNVVDELLTPSGKAFAQMSPIRVDVKELSEKYVLIADLPGVKKEDVKIKFEKGSLIIDVLAQEEVEKKEGEKFHLLERFKSFRSRSFYFGDNVNDAEIKASYLNGVLSLDIPKHQPSLKVRDISVD